MVHDTTHGENTRHLIFTTTADLIIEIQPGPGMCKHHHVSTNYDLKATLDRIEPRKVYVFK